MTRFVALLKAVNVAGQRMVAMADLRELCGELGLEDVRTLLQSGNVVFRGPAAATAALEARLEKAAAKRFGLTADFFVRTAPEWQAVVARNPFPEAALRDPGHLVVMFLKAAPNAAQVSALQAAIQGREQVRAVGRQAYLVYPDGIGRSRVTTALIERKLATTGTGRNWNTVTRLAASL